MTMSIRTVLFDLSQLGTVIWNSRLLPSLFCLCNYWQFLNSRNVNQSGLFSKWTVHPRNVLQHCLLALSQSSPMSLLPLQFNDYSQAFGMSFNLSESFHSHVKHLLGLFCTSQTHDISWTLECHPVWVDLSHFHAELQFGLFAHSQTVSCCLTYQMVANYYPVSFAIKQIYSFALKQIRSLCIQANWRSSWRLRCLNTF